MHFISSILTFLIPCIHAVNMEQGGSKRLKTENGFIEKEEDEEAQGERPPIKREVCIKTEEMTTPEAPPVVVKKEQVKQEPITKKEEQPARNDAPAGQKPAAASTTPNYSKDIDELSFLAAADCYNFIEMKNFGFRIIELAFPFMELPEPECDVLQNLKKLKDEVVHFEHRFKNGNGLVYDAPCSQLDARLAVLQNSGHTQEFKMELEKECKVLGSIVKDVRSLIRQHFGPESSLAATIKRLKETGKMPNDDNKKILFSLRDANVRASVRDFLSSTWEQFNQKVFNTPRDDTICLYFHLREIFFSLRHLLNYMQRGSFARQFARDPDVWYKHTDDFCLSR